MSLVRNPKRDMARGYVPLRRLDVAALIVEKDISAQRVQEGSLVQPAEKQRFVDSDIPGPEGAHDALVRRSAARRDQCGPDDRAVGGKFGLNAVQRGEKTLEGAARKRLAGGSDF